MPSSFAKRRVAFATALVITVCVWLALSTSLFPALSDDHPQNLHTIESDDPVVVREGEWTAQAAADASGGSYLYNTAVNPDRPDPALILQFSGAYLEVIYVSGPNLGTLAIEVDGTVLRTVITASDRTQYNLRTSINYLTDELHTLRVYAQSSGVIGVDAFVVTNQLSTSITNSEEQVQDSEGGIASGICPQTTSVSAVSRNPDGTSGGNNNSYPRAMTPDARWILFHSDANNLVVGDTNNSQDVFLFNRILCDTTRISMAYDGTQANGNSVAGGISADGRFIVYASFASNIVPNDTNDRSDIFLYDRQAGTTTLISLNQAGQQGNQNSVSPIISDDGRYIAFSSQATNLIPTDTSHLDDVYLYDRQLNHLELISISLSGSGGNGGSSPSDVSTDGRYILFTSSASNLHSNDTSNDADIYLRDRQLNLTILVSVNNTGQKGNSYSRYASMSDDGRYIAFESSASNLVVPDTNALSDIFLRDLQTNQVTRINLRRDGSQSFSGAYNPVISNDGRYVVFSSEDRYLDPNGSNGWDDVFLYDRQTSQMRLVSLSEHGRAGNRPSGTFYSIPLVSADGQWVIYASQATNLVSNVTLSTSIYNIFAFDANALFRPYLLSISPTGRNSAELTWQDYSLTETEYRIERSLSASGEFQEIAAVPFMTSYSYNDTGLEVFTTYYYRVRAYREIDQWFSPYSTVEMVRTYPACAPNALVQRVAMDNNGKPVIARDADMNGNGRYIVFSSADPVQPMDTANYFLQVYVHDTLTCNTTLISRTNDSQRANDDAELGSISDDGRWVAFASEATNLVSNTSVRVYQIYLHDLQTGQTILVSHTPNGMPGDARSFSPEVSSDGRFITFYSDATNLVTGDAVPAVSDVYVYDRQTDQISRVSVDSNGNAGNGNSSYPSISDDGRYVAFESLATNLVANDTNARRDIFVHDRQLSQTIRISTRMDGTQTSADSWSPMISGNGHYIVFSAHDALSSDPLEPPGQIYLRDLQTGMLELISRTADGAFADRLCEYPVITPDGRYVFYATVATNLGDDSPDTMINAIDNYVYDRQTQANFNANRDYLGNVAIVGSGGGRNAISDDGLITLWRATGGYVLPYSGGSGYYIYNRNYSPSPTPTNTPTSTHTFTPTASATASQTPSSTPSNTATWTGTPTATPSQTASNTPSSTPTSSATVTPSATHTPTLTATWTFTPTATASATNTPTSTPTSTPSVQPSATYTATPTFTRTPSNTPSATWTPSPTASATRTPQNFDTLAIYDTQSQRLYLLDTLTSQPNQLQTVQLSNPNPIVGVMGDWNGDGLKTPGYYAGGVFYTTNLLNPTRPSDWAGTWFGLTTRPAVAGRFAGSSHDCVGVVDSGYFPPYGIAFALYYTCDFSQPNPDKSFQWLSVVLPDEQGFTGTHQFETGDFDGDGFDSVAIRRGKFIAYTNITPGVGHAAFGYAQYWGSPDASGEGDFVTGDWDGNGRDSFGVYYPASHLFYRRNDLDWNSGVYLTQSLPTLNATAVSVSSWRVR